MSVEIHIGDCLSVMQGMPDDSVDLTVCSPPYEHARTYAAFNEFERTVP